MGNMVGIAHFHCPTCDPELIFGRTKAICGEVIPVQKTKKIPLNRNCGGCKSEMRNHKH